MGYEIDAYGDPGEDYPLDMVYRPDRMQRITAEDVMQRVRVSAGQERAHHQRGGTVTPDPSPAT